MKIEAFSAQSQTLTILAGTTASASLNLPAIGNNVRVVNEATVTVYVKIGTGAQTAITPTAGVPASVVAVLPGDVVFSIPNVQLQVSVITATGAGNIYFSVGEGV